MRQASEMRWLLFALHFWGGVEDFAMSKKECWLLPSTQGPFLYYLSSIETVATYLFAMQTAVTLESRGKTRGSCAVGKRGIMEFLHVNL